MHIFNPFISHTYSMKKLVLALGAAAVAFAAGAEALTPEQALARLPKASNGPAMAPGAAMKLSKTVMTPDNTQAAVYLFTRNNSELLFVGADDLAEPLLGYTDDDAIVEGEIPAQLQWWLSEYAGQIQAANVAAHSSRAESTDNDSDPNITYAPRSTERPSIKRHLPTRWNQDDPYNLFTPYLVDRNAPTGCVATAISQVMYYHKYPEVGQGSISYNPNPNSTSANVCTETLSMDFSTVTFDWDNMLPVYTSGEYTTTQAEAVAKLMQAVGYASKMGYQRYGSGAVTANAVVNMQTYFKYNSEGREISRSVMSQEAWDDAIYSNLLSVGPLVFAGSDPNGGGHAFVCDGYANGYFHFNWGWGGHYNGYFLTSSLTPEGSGIGGNFTSNYTFNQRAYINITRPDCNTITVECPGLILSDNLYAERENNSLTVTAEESNIVYSNCSNRQTIWELSFRYKSVNSEYVYDKFFQTRTLDPGYGPTYCIPSIPSDLPDDTYKVCLLFRRYGMDEEYQELPAKHGYNNYFYLTKADGDWSVENEVRHELDFSTITPQSVLHLKSTCQFTFTVSNSHEKELMDGFTPILYTKSSSASAAPSAGQRATSSSDVSIIGTGGLHMLSIPGGESVDHTWNENLKTSLTTAPSEPVYLGLQSVNSNKIYAETPVTVEDPTTSGPRFSVTFNLDGDPNNVDAQNIKFSGTAKNVGGYFSGTFGVEISKDGKTVDQITSKPYYIPTDGSVNYEISGVLPDAEKGVEYTAKLRFSYIEGTTTYISVYPTPITFTVGATLTGVEKVTSDEECRLLFENGAVEVSGNGIELNRMEVYAMDGRQVMAIRPAMGEPVSLAELSAGVYVVRATLADGRQLLAKVAK